MAIQYQEDTAVFSNLVSVDEAENLLEWLQKKTAARVDLAACTHVHPANLQVLMVARPSVSAWPRDESLAAWLRTALNH